VVTSRENEAEEALAHELKLERENMGRMDDGYFGGGGGSLHSGDDHHQRMKLNGLITIIQMMELLADCLGGTVLCVVIYVYVYIF
jgi:hypothetical protein